MKIESFEDIIAWKNGRLLHKKLVETFGELRDYSYKDQLFRASLSVMNNIAEGFERRSNKEFTHFLFIAKGSVAEVRSMLYVALDLRYCSPQVFESLLKDAVEIAKLLSGLIKTLNQESSIPKLS